MFFNIYNKYQVYRTAVLAQIYDMSATLKLEGITVHIPHVIFLPKDV